MNATTIITLILSLVETLAQDYPQLSDSLKRIFATGSPTPADWQAERDRVAALRWQDLVPHSQLPEDQ